MCGKFKCENKIQCLQLTVEDRFDDEKCKERLIILIWKSSDNNIIEYTISELCGGVGGLLSTLPFLSRGFSLSFSKL